MFGVAPFAVLLLGAAAVQSNPLAGAVLVWQVPRQFMSAGTLRKGTAEARRFKFDFALVPEIAAGDALTAAEIAQATISGAGELTIGAAAVVGDTVQLTISGGESFSLYRITATVTTALGRTLEGVGHLITF